MADTITVNGAGVLRISGHPLISYMECATTVKCSELGAATVGRL